MFDTEANIDANKVPGLEDGWLIALYDMHLIVWFELLVKYGLL